MSKILVVDDHDEIRDALAAILDEEGHEVVHAENGVQALKLAVEVSPDVILLDIAMPLMDGLEVLRRLKEDQSTESIAVIMVTAQGDRHAMVRAVQLGTRDYITKPWETGEVEMCVNWALKAKARAEAASVANAKQSA
ncbi:MAG: response regulator [Chloroflexi bacterium]|nr:response regulator [Chloroflexota bacterium]